MTTRNPPNTHLEVAEAIRAAIKARKYTERLPPETKLMEIHAVSRGVVRRALTILKQMGLVVVLPGSGWYVAGSVDTRPVHIQLYERIVRWGCKKGDRVPSEHRLAIYLGVSRSTIRAALMRLQSEGRISGATNAGRTVL